MPLLYYGLYGDDKKPQLYTPGMRRIETGVFDSFKLIGLAPRDELRAIANFWHWHDKKHTVISWHEETRCKYESSVFLPGLLKQADALELARVEFPEIMPSPIIFRFFQDYDEALKYD